MKFVLDGRQRLTALAIAFGGLRESDARRGFSGRWFINLDADPEENEEKCFFIFRYGGPKILPILKTISIRART
jgi:uncharacterized protein with ParB-like and HNH nuclease domain